jgi:solute:Na+ symporter, SSS family
MTFRPELGFFDLSLIVIYLAGITWFGLRFRKRENSLSGYFLAGQTTPWWAIALSIVAAETSTLTIISVPGVAFTGDFGFLQLVFGYLLGRVVICLIFLPRYFRGELLTAYQLIGQRFGPRLHRLTALLFLFTRAAAEGVRVFAVAIVVSIAIGTGDTASIAVISVLTLLYTMEGGLRAVIWTDVVQMCLYMVGVVAAVISLGHLTPGGWHAIYSTAAPLGKFTLFHFTADLTTAYTFWAGLLGGCFLTMASHGTDQLMVQRLLAARNLKESRLALLSSGVVVLTQFALFLLIGVGLFVFYGGKGAHFPSADRIFPAFIVEQMPVGVRGLMIAAVMAAAMSNLSAALNSLSSTTMIDFYLRLRPEATEKERNWTARLSTLVWAGVLFLLALASHGGGHVVEIGLSIASVAYGALLGVFLLGTLTGRATESGAMVGMLVGFVVNLVLWQQPHVVSVSIVSVTVTVPKIAWTWYVLIGSLLTFAVGYLFSLLLPDSRRTV